MIKLIKHKYLKYFLLVLLSLKGGFFVVESTSSINDSEICFPLDADDFENEAEDQEEFDESEKINQNLHIAYHFDQSKDINDHIIIFKKYRVQYIEYTTPPPKSV